MIGYLAGTVHTATEKDMIILVGGVGYKVLCPLPTLLSKSQGSEISLFIYTHVREDAIILFGFETEQEQEVFTKLLSVSGIGPKSALAMLSVNSASGVANAIEQGDAGTISSTPGIGKKTAEKVIIELKGKLSHLQTAGGTEHLRDVRLALEALGYSTKEISDVLQKIDIPEKDTSSLIKAALSQLK
jgi:Holliday junction DNA helicase RuvA